VASVLDFAYIPRPTWLPVATSSQSNKSASAWIEVLPLLPLVVITPAGSSWEVQYRGPLITTLVAFNLPMALSLLLRATLHACLLEDFNKSLYSLDESQAAGFERHGTCLWCVYYT
jgi:hypothetical protein